MVRRTGTDDGGREMAARRHTMTKPPIRRLALLGAILLGLAACGGGSSDATTPTLPTPGDTSAAGPAATTTTTVEVDPEEALQEYAACMREHGIDIPDPDTSGGGGVFTIGGEGSDPGAFDEAGKVCDPILEGAFGEFEMSPEQEAELRDQELVFARCMRDNGVDWPDPTGDFGSGGGVIELGDDTDSETMNAAMDTCSQEAFGGSGGFIIGGNGPDGGASVNGSTR
jgi:hypothetical protein